MLALDFRVSIRARARASVTVRVRIRIGAVIVGGDCTSSVTLSVQCQCKG